MILYEHAHSRNLKCMVSLASIPSLHNRVEDILCKTNCSIPLLQKNLIQINQVTASQVK